MEQNPLGGAGAPGALPMGGPPGPPMGGPPMPPMGGPPGLGGPPGMGGPPGLGGPPGMGAPPGGGQQQAQVTSLQGLDVWKVLEKILDGKPVEEPKNQGGQQQNDMLQNAQPSPTGMPAPSGQPSPTGMPAPSGPPPASSGGPPQHLMGVPGM